MIPDRPALAWRAIGAVVLVQAVVLLALAKRYGPHRDELYFVSAGRRPAWGYPDQPPFTPLLARLATDLAPENLVVLRLPALAAVVGLVVLSAHFARLLGGGRAAQCLTAVLVAASGVVMTLGHRLSTATFDTLAWTAILVLVTQARITGSHRTWLTTGLVAGVGLENKHSVAFLLGAIFVALALDPDARGVLRTRWPWLAGLLALALWAPNLVWQAQHDWPVRALSADIAEEYGGVGGRLALLGQALVMFSPFIAVIWIAGLVALLRRPEWRRARTPALAFCVVTGFFLVTGGKGYYLAGAITPLLAAGSTLLADRVRGRRLVGAGAALALTAAVAWPALVPVLPVRTYAGSFFTVIDEDQLETIGWPGYAGQVREVVEGLPDAERRTAVVFTRNYGEAGALEWYGVGAQVFSGHNAWRFWGPPPLSAAPVVVVGVLDPDADFTGCTREATLHNEAGADNEEEGRGVWVCEGPRGSWAARWPDLSHYDA